MANEQKLATMYVEIKAKTEELDNKLEELKNKTLKKSSEINNGFNGITTELMKVAVAAGVVNGAFNFLSDAVKASRDAAIALAQVETAIKKTGGSAGFTAGQLKRMADGLEESVGVDADEIMKGVTLQLLTFGQIQGDVFKRAQKTALDLSAVLGTDLKGQTIQLAKALENPKQGLTALAKSGITFTEVQKKQITELLKQNKLFEAQTIILDEIDSKYGDQAAALNDASGGTRNLQLAWDNLKETIGNALTPLLNDLIPNITKGIKGWIYLLETTADRIKRIREETADNIESGVREQITKMGKDERDWTKNNAEEILKTNRKKIEQNNKLIKQKSTEFRWSDAEINKLKEQNKTLEDSNILYRTQLRIINSIENPVKNINTITDDITDGINDQNDALKEKRDIESKLYDNLKFEARGYFDYAKNRINEYYDSLKKLYPDLSKLIEDSRNKELKELEKLNEKYFTGVSEKIEADKYQEDKLRKNFSNRAKMYKRDVDEYNKAQEFKFGGGKSGGYGTTGRWDEEGNEYITQTYSKAQSPSVTEGFTSGAQSPIKSTKPTPAEIEESFDIIKEMESALSQGLNSTAQDFATIVGEWAQPIENANSVVQKLINSLISATAQALALKLAMAAINFFTGGILGIGGAASAALHFGGTVVNGNKVPSFAGGGSFIVPEGFPNDSFPMLVESGERVTITPRNSVNTSSKNTDALLNELINSVRANTLTVAKTREVNLGDIYLDGEKVSKKVKGVENKLSKNGVKLDALR